MGLCAGSVGDRLSTNIHSGRAGGERRQFLNQNDVVARTKPGMDVVGQLDALVSFFASCSSPAIALGLISRIARSNTAVGPK